MKDHKRRAYALERRFRTLTQPWSEMIAEIRSERGALLGTERYSEMAGVEKAAALDLVDTRLQIAEEWLNHYAEEREADVSFSVKRWLKVAATLSDSELEGVL